MDNLFERYEISIRKGLPSELIQKLEEHGFYLATPLEQEGGRNVIPIKTLKKIGVCFY